MAKGYLIARIDVGDAERYGRYTAKSPEIIARHGGRFLTRGGRYDAKEGPARSRNVVIEFPSYEAALGFYDSPEYREILPHALAGSERELVIVEGFDG